MELLEGNAEIFQTLSKEGEKKGEHVSKMPKGRELKRGAVTASKGRLYSQRKSAVLEGEKRSQQHKSAREVTH